MTLKLKTPVGKKGKLTGYINATRNFQPIPAAVKAVAPTQPQRDVLGSKWGGLGYIDTSVPAVRAGAAAPGGSTGGNKKTTTQTAQDTLAQITNRYIASLLTPKQQAAQNTAWINASLKASEAQTNAAYDRQAKTLADQQARAKQYGLAFDSLRDMSGLQVGADYTNAARNLQGLGTGLTGAIAEAQQQESAQQAQQIAAATQGFGQAKPLDVAGMQNISQYTGVLKPAGNLYEEAANQAAEARWNQDIRAQQIKDLATEYGTKKQGVESDRAAKLAEIAATRPSLYQQAMQTAQSGSRSDMATIISALALQNQTAKVPSEIGENVASAAATKSNAGVNVAKVTGVTKDGKLVGGYYWSAPGQKTAGKIPEGMRLYEGDPTHHVVVPKGEFYFRGKGMNDPQPIPKNWMPDPADPSHHKIVKNPFAFAPPTTPASGETPAQKNRRVQGLVTKWASTIDKAMTTAGSPYAEDVANPILEKAGTAKPQWVPKPGMTYAKAFADIVKRLPAELRKNPQMIANVNTSLARAGFKVPTAGAKKTTTKTKSKTPTLKGPSASDLLGLP